MRQVIAFEVVGLPQSQGSTTTYVKGGKRHTTSANKNLKSWRKDVKDTAREAMELYGIAMLEGAVHLTVDFKFTRPKGHFGKRGLLPSAPKHKTTQPDLDKCLRAICDSLVDAGVLRDDSLVVSCCGNKDFDTWNGARIRVLDLEAADDEVKEAA